MSYEGKIRHNLYSNHPKISVPAKEDSLHPQDINEELQPWYSRLWNWQPKETLALKLLQDIDIHGLKYTVQKDRHIVERAFWVLILMTSLSAAIYMSYDVILMYNASPVIVSFQPAQTSISQIPFPAITVCNANPFRKSSFDNAVKLLREERKKSTPNSSIVELYQTFLRQMDHMCSTADSFSVKLGYSLNETTTNICERDLGFDDCHGPRSSRPGILSNITTQKLQLMTASYQSCGELIPKCIWEGVEQEDCSDIFTPVVTDLGICCVFNMMPRDILLNTEEFAGAGGKTVRGFLGTSSEDEFKFWTKELNFDELLNKVPSQGELNRSFLKFQSKAGQPAGLSFIVNPEINETFCASHDSFGFRILAHQATEYPQVSDFGIAVGPASEVFLSLQADVTKAEPDIREIDMEKRNCFYKNEYKLRSFSEYTWSNCISECVGRMIGDACNCSRFDMPQSSVKGQPYCEGDGFNCAEEIKVKIANEGTKFNCPQCRPSCNRIEYKVSSSTIPTRSDVNLWLKDGLGETWSSKNVTIVHAFFSSDTVYSRVRKRIFTYNELFANVGGILGLFLGFSVISAVEPIYFIYRMWCDKKSRRVGSTTTVSTLSTANDTIMVRPFNDKQQSLSAGLAALDSFSTQYYYKLNLQGGRISKKAPYNPHPFHN